MFTVDRSFLQLHSIRQTSKRNSLPFMPTFVQYCVNHINFKDIKEVWAIIPGKNVGRRLTALSSTLESGFWISTFLTGRLAYFSNKKDFSAKKCFTLLGKTNFFKDWVCPSEILLRSFEVAIFGKLQTFASELPKQLIMNYRGRFLSVEDCELRNAKTMDYGGFVTLHSVVLGNQDMAVL